MPRCHSSVADNFALDAHSDRIVTAAVPQLERRAAVLTRQPRTARRRSLRILTRFITLAVFDAVAFVVARALMSALAAGGVVAFASKVAVFEVGPLSLPGHPVSLVYPVTLFAALAVLGSYARNRTSVIAMRVLGANAAAAAATAIALAAILGVRYAVVYAFSFGVMCSLVQAAGRLVGDLFATRVWPRNLGALPAIGIRSRESDRPQPGFAWGDYAVVESIRVEDEGAEGVPTVLAHIREMVETQGVEAVVVGSDIPESQLAALIEGALDIRCRIIYPARAVPVKGVRPRLVWYGGEPFFEVGTPVLRTGALITKRVVDLIGSATLIVLTAPVMLVIATAVRLDSPGPILFRQVRAGLGGRPFRMLKFRTMTADADSRKQEVAHLNRSGDVRLFKVPDDPRVTRIGRVLRRWSLDELPQFFNVFWGDMSLVGPRPFFEADFAKYEDHHFRRLDTKPGLTGLWQVSGRSEVVDFDDVIFLDRQYIEQWSFWLDLSILARTIPAVLRRRGAY